MSVQQHQSPSSASNPLDLETTAELPVLDVASTEAAAEEPLGATDTWVTPGFDPATRSEGALEAQLHSLADKLRDVEERLRIKDARVVELEREIEQFGDERRAVASRIVAADGVLRTLEEREARVHTLEVRTAHLEACLADAEQALERHVEERHRVTADLQRELAEAKAQAASHLEVLQSLEGRRGIWELALRGLDHELDAREARLASVEVELSRRSGHASELQSELASRTERVHVLEQEVSQLATALAQRVQELGTFQAAAAAQLASEQVAARTDSVTVLEGQLREATARALELESDLPAAEDTIHRLEAELRSKSSRLEELARTSEKWRDAAEAACRSLEADAAGSAAPVPARSLQRPEPTAGAEPPPEGATRLLVRTSGDAEVVHVLGRKTTVGRTPDNDLQIDARFISRHHAVILAGPVQTLIEDLNSTNGVRVNSRRVTRQVLKDGDIVIIGKTRFRFAVRQAAQRG